MAYVLPTFNLTCGIWDPPYPPPIVRPPDREYQCNLAWGRRTAVPSTGGTTALGVVLMTMTLLLPKLANVVGDPNLSGSCSAVEVPLGSKRFYRVAFTDDIGKGFANEHRAAILVQWLPWAPPIP